MFQGPVSCRSGLEPPGNRQTLRTVWHENASGKGPRERPVEFGGSTHGNRRVSTLHENQHVFVGEDKENIVQKEKVPY